MAPKSFVLEYESTEKLSPKERSKSCLKSFLINLKIGFFEES